MPFGERFGSIRPRASYMRSVCGCMFGELGGDRDHEHAAVGRDLDALRGARSYGVGRPAAVGVAARASLLTRLRRIGGAIPRARAVGEQPRARDRRSIVCESASTACSCSLAELLGHVDHEAVVDVARSAVAAPERRASAGPRRAGAGRCRGRCPGARAASWCRSASAPAPRRRAAPRGSSAAPRPRGCRPCA